MAKSSTRTVASPITEAVASPVTEAVASPVPKVGPNMGRVRKLATVALITDAISTIGAMNEEQAAVYMGGSSPVYRYGADGDVDAKATERARKATANLAKALLTLTAADVDVVVRAAVGVLRLREAAVNHRAAVASTFPEWGDGKLSA